MQLYTLFLLSLLSFLQSRNSQVLSYYFLYQMMISLQLNHPFGLDSHVGSPIRGADCYLCSLQAGATDPLFLLNAMRFLKWTLDDSPAASLSCWLLYWFFVHLGPLAFTVVFSWEFFWAIASQLLFLLQPGYFAFYLWDITQNF